MVILTKTCIDCGATHHKYEFPKDSRRCQPCHKERARLSSLAWRQRHPERAKVTHRTSQARRRAANPELMREKGAVTNWDQELDLLVANEAAELCKQREVSLGGKWHVDHTVPLAAKSACGLHNAYNLAVVPAKYNTSKKNSFDESMVNSWGWIAC